ncbi:hypothetical protein BDR07DRAFT_1375633 [Suillus spraguei]|nr:hypothetical protein BDR07DRAFT_1375633 [Suillus spraguei]
MISHDVAAAEIVFRNINGTIPRSSSQQRQPSQSLVGFVDSGGRSQTQSLATEKPLPGNDSSEGHPPARDRNDPYADFEPILRAPPATRSRDGHMIRGLPRGTVGLSQAPDLGWIVPVNERPHILNLTLQRKTIKERLEPSIRDARRERNNTPEKVLLGALTTGLAAALSSSSGNKVGSPPLLLRLSCFEMDHGHEYGTDKNGLNDRLEHLRKRFEELLGNADGWWFLLAFKAFVLSTISGEVANPLKITAMVVPDALSPIHGKEHLVMRSKKVGRGCSTTLR